MVSFGMPIFISFHFVVIYVPVISIFDSNARGMVLACQLDHPSSEQTDRLQFTRGF